MHVKTISGLTTGWLTDSAGGCIQPAVKCAGRTHTRLFVTNIGSICDGMRLQDHTVGFNEKV